MNLPFILRVSFMWGGCPIYHIVMCLFKNTGPYIKVYIFCRIPKPVDFGGFCWFSCVLSMRNRFVWWFCIDIACATFFLKAILEKVGTFWNLDRKKSRFFENFENLEIFRIFEISIFNRIFNENQNLENLGNFRNFQIFQKISIFFGPNFNSSQLFRELLWKKMSHMVYRCKIIVQIDCAYLERMKINTNHLNRQIYESTT